MFGSGCATPSSHLLAPQRHVYAVTTHRGRHLFGVHRADHNQNYTSYVLGFDRQEHALAIAKGLEAYRRAHGRFPPRDLDVDVDDLDLARQDYSEAGDMIHVAVDAMQLSDLMERLRGTGIILSLLSPVEEDDDEDDLVFKWTDIESGGSPWHRDTVGRLNSLLPLRGDEPPPAARRGVPALLPKPRWPARPRVGRALAFSGAMLMTFGGLRLANIAVLVAAWALSFAVMCQ